MTQYKAASKTLGVGEGVGVAQLQSKISHIDQLALGLLNKAASVKAVTICSFQ
jgi:hypothetical protein